MPPSELPVDVEALAVENDVPRFSAGSIERGSVMSEEQAIPKSRGVSIELLSALNLGPEIKGLAGRQLRMRRVTIAPGGVFGPLHDHVGRPGTVYVLRGTITDHRDGASVEYGPGPGWPEDSNTRHWLENTGTTVAVEISVDIVERD